MSPEGENVSATWLPILPNLLIWIAGVVAMRDVGSIVTSPFAAMDPARKVSEETCPPPPARRLRMKRRPPSGAPDWSGWVTMLGLNNAAASKEYSWRK